ncbi:MAG: hypothetical protein ACT4O0_07655 [Pseudonocardia sp.]
MTDTRLSAAELAEVVRAHPAVVSLSGGPYATVATYLPGERLFGVKFGAAGEPVEIAVVLRLTGPLPPIVAELRREVSARCGGAPVDVIVTDVVVDPPAAGPAGRGPD